MLTRADHDDETLERLVREMLEPDGATAGLGGTLLPVRDGKVTFRLEIRPEHLNGHTICHGGVLAMMLDTVAGLSVCQEDRVPVTVSSSINYFYPARLGQTVEVIGVQFTATDRYRTALAHAIGPDGAILTTMHAVFRLLDKPPTILKEEEGK